ncbi:hypothetical protein [Pseudogemmobacter humi]|uniref:Uncharacterized protein n=1 Tax=Pseudogemmobacter humi TaxID=2483812 RepID=A0A3P5XUS1_9RHOB|nr:hypothetical protein [Pseudogemmobacter humi]VDC31818.1 hypothetical protein XINFAN_03173 [Pseudogemmobacter humi]
MRVTGERGLPAEARAHPAAGLSEAAEEARDRQEDEMRRHLYRAASIGVDRLYTPLPWLIQE